MKGATGAALEVVWDQHMILLSIRDIFEKYME